MHHEKFIFFIFRIYLYYPQRINHWFSYWNKFLKIIHEDIFLLNNMIIRTNPYQKKTQLTYNSVHKKKRESVRDYTYIDLIGFYQIPRWYTIEHSYTWFHSMIYFTTLYNFLHYYFFYETLRDDIFNILNLLHMHPLNIIGVFLCEWKIFTYTAKYLSTL